jgi:peptide/nickel transport system permease protein
MAGFIIRRFLISIPLLLGISFIVFALINLIPGSPIQAIAENPRARPEDIARIRANLGLDQPWPVRYFIWLGDAVRGNLGYSLTNFTSVTDRVLGALPNTLLLSGLSFLIALLVSIPLGVLSAVRRNSWIDHFLTVTSTAAFAVPIFWLGFLLILVFAVQFREWDLPAFPVSGTHDARGGGGFFDRLQHLILPALALGLKDLASFMRYIRGAMLENVRQDYVRTAQAKGLGQRAVIFGHAFRNSLISLATLIGLSLPGLFGGAFLIEQIFAWPGMGRLAIDALQDRDYTLAMGTLMFFAVLTILGNFLADVLYAALDPRIRYD